MKKIFVLILFISVALTGCSSPETEPQTSTTAQSSVLKGASMESDRFEEEEKLREQQNEEIWNKHTTHGLDGLITKSYPQADLIDQIRYWYGPNFVTLMQQLDQMYPFECFRTFENTLPYCIYKLDEGGLLFVFLSPGGAENYKDNKFVEYIFAVKEPLTKESFAGIKVGMSLADVESIDAGTKLINSINSGYLNGNKTQHMVKEGFFAITYEDGDFDSLSLAYGNPESFKIKSIEFVPNGGAMSGQFGDECRYTFLTDDYPQ